MILYIDRRKSSWLNVPYLLNFRTSLTETFRKLSWGAVNGIHGWWEAHVDQLHGREEKLSEWVSEDDWWATKGKDILRFIYKQTPSFLPAFCLHLLSLIFLESFCCLLWKETVDFKFVVFLQHPSEFKFYSMFKNFS